jgi:hypothetical protein
VSIESIRDWPARWLAAAAQREAVVRRPYIARPFGLEIDGTPHIVATDARIMIAVEAEHDLPPLPVDKERIVRNAFGNATDWVTVDLDALCSFAGNAEPPHFCTCIICGAQRSKVKFSESRPGWIGPARVDLAYVAEILDGAPPAQTIEVTTERLAQHGEARRLRMRGYGWQAVLMGLSVSGDVDNPVEAAEPRFTLPTAATADAA